jgi:adenylate kinase family enzyme
MSPGKRHDLVFVGGPPGVGKSTVAKTFCDQDASTQQIGVGDLIRSVRLGTQPSRYSDAVIAAATQKKLVPPDVFSGLLHEKIAASTNNISLSLIDGFPYSRDDWNTFTIAAMETKLRLAGLVVLRASVELCVDRMAGRGMREGEQIRIMSGENQRSFYQRRYAEYLHKQDEIKDIFLSSGMRIMDIDATDEKNLILPSFKSAVEKLRNAKGDYDDAQ